MITAVALLASTYTFSIPHGRINQRMQRIQHEMSFESLSTTDRSANTFAINQITRSRMAGRGRNAGRILVTEGSGSLYGMRTLFQLLHDFGRHKSIISHSTDAASAKKSLITRSARYSGLIDALDCRDGDLAEAMESAEMWLAINADEAALPFQIETAKAAGVQRAFVLLTGSGPTPALTIGDEIEALLKASGMKFTIMRTGQLVDSEGGGGLKLDALDLPVCEAVAKEDVFRFVTEALTLPDANGRMFSLCPTDDSSILKQMRLCGYERREEIEGLLQGLVGERPKKSDETASEAQESELVLRSTAEVEAEREEELKALLARARERGEMTQRRNQYEESEKEQARSALENYYKAPSGGSDGTAAPIKANESDEAPSTGV
mmetsp:Transcript_37414/g.61972  ORF Transcript_37414/g.61972 Transcript_37414/m.61972 type:complete len:380 (-) Transcript_37414:324-1463(-)